MAAFSQLDLAQAMAVMKEEELEHKEVGEFVTRLVEPMMANLHVTSYCVELIYMAKSLELITDHARHIAELVLYVVVGADVRHMPVEQMESQLQ